MALRLTSINVRLNTDVAWWSPTAEQKAYVKTNYDDTGKRVEISATGHGGLTKTKIVEFTDEATKAAWDADSMIQERRAYLQARNISQEFKTENT
jgi:hypothetical protein